MKRLAFRAAAAAIVLLFGLGARDRPNQSFQVVLTGLELQAVTGVAIGAERPVRQGDSILNAAVGMERGALLQEPLTASVAGLDYRLTGDEPLVAAREATGGDLHLHRGAHVFCAKMEEARRNAIGSRRYVSKLDRYSHQTRLCLVDADNDQRFEKAFVIGAKLPRDWKLTDIAPVRYREHRHIALGRGWSLNIRYMAEKSPGKGYFQATLLLRGEIADISWIKLRSDKWRTVGIHAFFSSKKLPFRYEFGSAAFVVTAVGEGGITLRQESGLDYVPLDYVLRAPIGMIIYI